MAFQRLDDQHQYLYLAHPRDKVFEGQVKLTTAMQFRPYSTASVTHKKLTASVLAKHQKVFKTKTYITTENPEQAKLRAEKVRSLVVCGVVLSMVHPFRPPYPPRLSILTPHPSSLTPHPPPLPPPHTHPSSPPRPQLEQEKIRNRKKLEAKRRSVASRHSSSLTVEGLEAEEYSDFDDDLGFSRRRATGVASSGAAGRGRSAAASRRKMDLDMSDDEQMDDYEEDDFVVDDDFVEKMDDDDDDDLDVDDLSDGDGEDDDDDDDEEEAPGGGEEQDSRTKAKRSTGDDAPATAAGVADKKRRVIESDDEDD